MNTYRVNEIFYSIQGEGHHVGKPTVFIRLSGCNRSCSFCDTTHQAYRTMNPYQIYSGVLDACPDPPSVTITGGEPFEQNLEDLITLIPVPIRIETNGTGEYFKPGRAWITHSPKDKHPRIQCQELKLLCGIELPDWEEIIWFFSGPHAGPRYVQPIDGQNYEANLNMAITFVKEHPAFALSLQLHKLIGVR